MLPSQTAEIMSDLAAVFPNHPLEARTIEVYATMLADLDYETAKSAVAVVLSKVKFFPTIAEIREAAGANELGGLCDASEAWDEVYRAISREGRYRNPKFSNVAIDECVRSIGWDTLCSSEKISVERAHFMQFYEGKKRKQATQAQLLRGATIMARLPERT